MGLHEQCNNTPMRFSWLVERNLASHTWSTDDRRGGISDFCTSQLTVVAYDDGVPADKTQTKVNIVVRRNENGPVFPNLGPYIVSYEVRPGHVIVNINATDADGVSYVTLLLRPDEELVFVISLSLVWHYLADVECLHVIRTMPIHLNKEAYINYV